MADFLPLLVEIGTEELPPKALRKPLASSGTTVFCRSFRSSRVSARISAWPGPVRSVQSSMRCETNPATRTRSTSPDPDTW